MRRTLLAILIAANASVLCATVNVTTRWEDNDTSLAVTGNYGTPLGETLHLNNHRAKGYHLFNLLNAAKKSSSVSVNLQDPAGPGLDFSALGRHAGVTLQGTEEFNPVFDQDTLFYQRWTDGILELYSGDIPVYRQEDAFDFIGKRGETAVISKAGALMFLSEVEWIPVDTLVGYSAANVRWIDKDNIICHAERNTDGRRFTVIASIRRPSALFLPAMKGEFIDAVVTPDRNIIYSLYREGEKWVLYRYSYSDNNWLRVREFEYSIDLMGIRNERVYWFDPSSGSIEHEDGIVRVSYSREINLYPQGRYVSGEAGTELEPASPKRLVLLFYAPEREKPLERQGFSAVEKFEGSSSVWIFPEEYQSSLQALRPDMGHAFFSPDDMKVYYDTFRRGLRQTGSLKVRPSVRGTYVLYLLAVLLLILVINEIVRKNRGFMK